MYFVTHIWQRQQTIFFFPFDQLSLSANGPLLDFAFIFEVKKSLRFHIYLRVHLSLERKQKAKSL